MTRFREIGVRCDGCGIISSDLDGYYVRGDEHGNISSQGRECEHDYCERCEAEHAPSSQCRRCGDVPDGEKRCPICGAARMKIRGIQQATCGQPTCEATAATRLLRGVP